MMKFTQHALDKLDLYCIPTQVIADECKHAIHEFYDEKEHSNIKIIHVKGVLLALVIDPVTDDLITIYRTDEKTINNRRKAKRWV